MMHYGGGYSVLHYRGVLEYDAPPSQHSNDTCSVAKHMVYSLSRGVYN